MALWVLFLIIIYVHKTYVTLVGQQCLWFTYSLQKRGKKWQPGCPKKTLLKLFEMSGQWVPLWGPESGFIGWIPNLQDVLIELVHENLDALPASGFWLPLDILHLSIFYDSQTVCSACLLLNLLWETLGGIAKCSSPQGGVIYFWLSLWRAVNVEKENWAGVLRCLEI